ncbi:MAG: hypothetical protein A2Z14_06685 [Chloroflexi bacterium RBG_16_48_8]|nr:MAG: hypothetical protein A2Z14_06685 [Chloroflexi bacterium RBG_16_48_8]
MSEPEKITIIEGPPPTFEASSDPLLLGMAEGPSPMQVVMCHLRTNNGPELTERCYRAWKKGDTIRLEFKSEEGLTLQAPIVASRWAELPEGHLLMLWVRMDDEDIAIDLNLDLDDFNGDFDDEFDEPFNNLDLDLPI